MQCVKRLLAPVIAGVVVLGGISYVAVADEAQPPSDDVVLAQQSTEDGDGRHRPHHRPLPRAIRGELVVHAREGDGFETVRFDRGVLDRVDGSTLVINEDDGTTVEIPTDDETRIGRDGERAELADLQPGDHVAAFRVKEGDAFVTKGVRATSPARWEENENRRGDARRRFQGRRSRGA